MRKSRRGGSLDEMALDRWERCARMSRDRNGGQLGRLENGEDSRLCSAVPATALDRTGELASREVPDEVLLRGRDDVRFAKGWLSGEDSTGEFWASPKSNQKARVIFWEDVYAASRRYPGYWRRVRPAQANECESGLAPEESELDGLQAEERQDRHDPRSRRRHWRLGWSGNDDPGCPAKPCANFLLFPQWGEPYGIAGKSMSRSTSPTSVTAARGISSWPSSRRPEEHSWNVFPHCPEADRHGARTGDTGLTRTNFYFSTAGRGRVAARTPQFRLATAPAADWARAVARTYSSRMPIFSVRVQGSDSGLLLGSVVATPE